MYTISTHLCILVRCRYRSKRTTHSIHPKSTANGTNSKPHLGAPSQLITSAQHILCANSQFGNALGSQSQHKTPASRELVLGERGGGSHRCVYALYAFCALGAARCLCW